MNPAMLEQWPVEFSGARCHPHQSMNDAPSHRGDRERVTPILSRRPCEPPTEIENGE